MNIKGPKPKYEAPKVFLMGELAASCGGCSNGFGYVPNCNPTGSGYQSGQTCVNTGSLPT